MRPFIATVFLVLVLVKEEIMFDQAPPIQYPWSGTDALIQCEVSGNPIPTMWWRLRGKIITPVGRYGYEPDGLRIHNITDTDTGLYTWVAEVAAEGRVSQALIQVVVN